MLKNIYLEGLGRLALADSAGVDERCMNPLGYWEALGCQVFIPSDLISCSLSSAAATVPLHPFSAQLL